MRSTLWRLEGGRPEPETLDTTRMRWAAVIQTYYTTGSRHSVLAITGLHVSSIHSIGSNIVERPDYTLYTMEPAESEFLSQSC